MYWKIIEKLKKKCFSNTTFWKNYQMQIFQKKILQPRLSFHPPKNEIYIEGWHSFVCPRKISF